MPESNDHFKVALVTVFKDLASAGKAVFALQQAGFSHSHVELVTYGLDEQSHEVGMPVVPRTTVDSLVHDAGKWGALGLSAGAAAGVVAAISTFPGFAIGMIVFGGLTGALVGGMAGIDKAVHDDTVNLPSLDAYEKLLKEGHKLVVLMGTHEDAARAKQVLAQAEGVYSHIHPVGEHRFHEHPDATGS